MLGLDFVRKAPELDHRASRLVDLGRPVVTSIQH
jgi:hypothetical protein